MLVGLFLSWAGLADTPRGHFCPSKVFVWLDGPEGRTITLLVRFPPYCQLAIH